MLKKQAPGETILKVGGMLLLFLGVLLAFGSGNNLSLVMKGSSDSAVVEYLNQNGMTYSQLVASNVMVLVAGVIYLAAGVVGVKHLTHFTDGIIKSLLKSQMELYKAVLQPRMLHRRYFHTFTK